MIEKIWKDPVWSKVISFIIIAIGTLLYNYIISLYNDEDFRTTFLNFWKNRFELWQFLLFLILLVTIISIITYRNKKKMPKQTNAFDNFDLESLKPMESYDEQSKKLDTEIYLKIRDKLLPGNKSINWLRHQNFAGFGFRREAPDDFFNFESTCSDPNFVFLDSDLEEIKVDLQKNISELTGLLALNTFPQSNGIQTVPPEWEIEQSERFDEVIKKLSESREKVIESYDKLMREGRKKLKI